MGWIDVAIPGVAGLLATTCPQLFVKPSDDFAADAARLAKLRKIGTLLLGVAALYCFTKLANEGM